VKILLTGATGFVGSRLTERLRENKTFDLSIAVRRALVITHGHAITVGEIDGTTDWSSALKGRQVVIHAAARAHIMKEKFADPLAEYRKVNVDGTLNLARQAAAVGVKRFIFISSIKVNGEKTRPGQAFFADDIPAPEDYFGVSKTEAEQGMVELAKESNMEIVIIRPTLVYGPHVGGNFATLIKAVQKDWPLPLGSIDNKRSLVALDNLVDLISTCVDHPQAANQVFLAADGDDLSTTELLQRLAYAMGRTSRLIRFPAVLLNLGAMLLGKKAMADRLLGSMQVDISKSADLLGWEPPLTVETGFQQCVLRGLDP
jgi:nucleoside-diphosphate-sugar epimerase